MLVVPGVFADGERHLLAAKWKQQLAFCGSEVAHFVEDIVGGQKHFGLQEGDAAVFEQGGGVHYRFAALRLGGSDEAADHGDAAGFGGDTVESFAVVLDKRGALNQVARRIAADGKFGKKN